MSQKRCILVNLQEYIRESAKEHGFHAVGFASAEPLIEDERRYRRWLEAGCHADMTYLERWLDVRFDPRIPGMVEGAKSIVCFAMAYPLEPPRRGVARHIAAYARGQDYHHVVRDRLRLLLVELEQRSPGLRGRALVDSAPILERAWAQRAGLGWIGRNSCLIHPELGSAFVLGELVITEALDSDAPLEVDGCAQCERCVTACPGHALSRQESGRLDARRCLSYWTIEALETLEADSEAGRSDAFFGCDVCQLQCPYNVRRPRLETALEPLQRWLELELEDIARLELDELKKLIRGTALQRAGAEALRRRARTLCQR